MGSLPALVLIVVLAICVWIYTKHRQHQAEQRLRDNPPPRRLIEVSLPYGYSDSNERMKRFYRKAASATGNDPKARKQGLRQLDVVYLAETPRGALQPEIRFLIYSDPDQMDKVKRAIKQAFDGGSDVFEPSDDPLAEIAGEMRPPKLTRREQPEPEADGLDLDEDESWQDDED